MKKICFTGRRPKDLCGYVKANYTSFVDELVTILKEYITEDTEFISGGAQGFDQLSFWAVDKICSDNDTGYTVTNTVYVPFRGQERQWLSSGLFSQAEYRLMLSRASRVNYLKETLTDTKAIIRALYDRNHSMVNDSDMVIALYPSDEWQTAKGGTAECMRYAKSHGKPIIQLCYEIVNGKLVIKERKTIS